LAAALAALVTQVLRKLSMCELKIDGSALALTYEHGVLVRGATGDGIRRRYYPKCGQSARPAIEFRKPTLIEVRGEAFTVRVFQQINRAGDRWGAF